MDASSSQRTVEVVHIHNYSLYAIKSLICEIKKFPIIYKNQKDICLGRELIDLAWCRIIAAVLDCEGMFSSTEKAYWDLSFRQLWRWMRWMLVRDMKARVENHVHIRNPEYSWLDHLKFVEKHIVLDEETVEMEEPNPSIHIQLISADTDVRETSKDTVIWVRDSRESTSNESEGISIRLRSTVNACKDLNIQRTCSTSLSSFDSNDLQTGNSPCLEPMPALIPASSTSSFTGNPPPSAQSSLPAQNVGEDDLVVPQQQTLSLVIDEDFQFIMSLLPELKKLEPKLNADVKMQIMQALHDAF